MVELLARTWSFLTAMTSATTHLDGQAGDGREAALLKYVLENAKMNPESVLKTIDLYARKSWLMNVGDEKGMLVVKALKDANTKFVLELGAYVGYSATLLASNLQPGGKLFSLEMNRDNANIARRVVEHAGLSDKVEIVQGVLKDKVEELKKLVQAESATVFDFVFIDHDKRYYLSDLLILVEHGLVGKGTVLVADNMRIPGSPEYRRYMKENEDKYETIEHTTRFEYLTFLPDSVLISTRK